MVLRADRCDLDPRTSSFQDASLVPGGRDPSRARGALRHRTSPPAGYYQFDLVHPATAPEAMGSVRFAIGEHAPRIVRPQLDRGAARAAATW